MRSIERPSKREHEEEHWTGSLAQHLVVLNLYVGAVTKSFHSFALILSWYKLEVAVLLNLHLEISCN